MNLKDVLYNDDREITIRPFDGRWEAVLTVYSQPNRKYRGVDGSPSKAVEAAYTQCAAWERGGKGE